MMVKSQIFEHAFGFSLYFFLQLRNKKKKKLCSPNPTVRELLLVTASCSRTFQQDTWRVMDTVAFFKGIRPVNSDSEDCLSV